MVRSAIGRSRVCSAHPTDVVRPGLNLRLRVNLSADCNYFLDESSSIISKYQDRIATNAKHGPLG